MQVLTSTVKTVVLPDNAPLHVRIPARVPKPAADDPYALSPQEAAKALRRAGIVMAKGRLGRIFR